MTKAVERRRRMRARRLGDIGLALSAVAILERSPVLGSGLMLHWPLRWAVCVGDGWDGGGGGQDRMDTYLGAAILLVLKLSRQGGCN